MSGGKEAGQLLRLTLLPLNSRSSSQLQPTRAFHRPESNYGIGPTQKSLTLSYSPEDQWRVEVEYGDITTVSKGNESIHSTLSIPFFQMGLQPLGASQP